MAEQRTYQGATYERDTPAQPWRLVGEGQEGTMLSDPRQPYQMRRDQAGARRDEYGAENAPVDDRFTRENTLRQQFNNLPEVQRYREVVPIYISARDAADTRAGDLNLTYAFGKVMDPGSVVREAEQVMVQGTSPIADRIRGLMSEIDRSGRLSAETRRHLMGELQSRRHNLARSYAQARDQYTASAREYGLEPDRVVGQHPAEPYAAQERGARGNPLNPEQQRLYDAFMAANPSATAEQLRAFGREAGLGSIDNADEVVGRRREGAGVAPGAAAQFGGSAPLDPETTGQIDSDSALAQSLSGVNEGIASTLGAPVDLTASALNLVPAGIDAVANTNLPRLENSLLGGDWWRNLLTGTGSIAPESDDPSNQFMRRAGQSVGSAVIPIAGTAGTLGRAGLGFLTAAGGGAGAATAQQIAPGNPIAEIGGEILGSAGAGAGLFGLARRQARNAALDAVPSSQQLRADAGNLYAQAESRGVVADESVTSRIADRVRNIAREEELVTPTGRVSEDYPRARGAMTLLDDYSGQTMNPRQIQVVRNTLSDAVGSTEGNERRIARLMLKAFDEETTPLAPELAQARRTSSRYLQGDQIQRATDLAEPRAANYSQSGTENALRTEFRGLDRGIIRGDNNFPQPVVDAIENVSRGTPGSNVARYLGRLAPSTMFASTPGAMAGLGVGAATGDPVLAALATGTAWAGGTAARSLASRMTARNASVAEALARAGGDIGPLPTFDDELRRQLALQLAGQSSAALYETQ